METKTIIIVLAIILFLLIMLNHIIITPVIPPKPIGGCAGTMIEMYRNGEYKGLGLMLLEDTKALLTN